MKHMFSSRGYLSVNCSISHRAFLSHQELVSWFSQLLSVPWSYLGVRSLCKTKLFPSFVFESQVFDSSVGKNLSLDKRFIAKQNQWLGRGIGGLQIHLLLWKELRRFDFHLTVAGWFFILMLRCPKVLPCQPIKKNSWHWHIWIYLVKRYHIDVVWTVTHLLPHLRKLGDPRPIGIWPGSLQDNGCPLDEVSGIPRFRSWEHVAIYCLYL